MREDRWKSKRVEGSITVGELLFDYSADPTDQAAIDQAAQISALFTKQPKIAAVLLEDEAGMVYEITR